MTSSTIGMKTIKKVTACKLSQNGSRVYKVKWESTWESEESLVGCQDLVDQFWSLVSDANDACDKQQSKCRSEALIRKPNNESLSTALNADDLAEGQQSANSEDERSIDVDPSPTAVIPISNHENFPAMFDGGSDSHIKFPMIQNSGLKQEDNLELHITYVEGEADAPNKTTHEQESLAEDAIDYCNQVHTADGNFRYECLLCGKHFRVRKAFTHHMVSGHKKRIASTVDESSLCQCSSCMQLFRNRYLDHCVSMPHGKHKKNQAVVSVVSECRAADLHHHSFASDNIDCNSSVSPDFVCLDSTVSQNRIIDQQPKQYKKQQSFSSSLKPKLNASINMDLSDSLPSIASGSPCTSYPMETETIAHEPDLSASRQFRKVVLPDGNRKFECLLCGKKFQYKHSWKGHMQVVHKKLLTKNTDPRTLNSCQFCHRKFNWRSNFNRHLRECHGVHPSRANRTATGINIGKPLINSKKKSAPSITVSIGEDGALVPAEPPKRAASVNAIFGNLYRKLTFPNGDVRFECGLCKRLFNHRSNCIRHVREIHKVLKSQKKAAGDTSSYGHADRNVASSQTRVLSSAEVPDSTTELDQSTITSTSVAIPPPSSTVSVVSDAAVGCNLDSSHVEELDDGILVFMSNTFDE